MANRLKARDTKQILANIKAETLVDALADTLVADTVKVVEAEKLIDTVPDVEAKTPVHGLADGLTQVEP